MAVEKRQADQTRFAIGKETDATGSPIQDRTDLTQTSYVATSFTVDEDAEKVQSDALRAAYADVFGELNALWGSGGIALEVPEGVGLLPIMEALLGDQSPVSTAVPSKTLFTVADVLDVTATTPLYFQEAGDTTVNVVNAAALNAAITIANNLSEYDTAQALTVAPSADPDNTGADIVINYTDGDGISQSGTLSFDDDTAQTFDLPANSTITSVTATAADWTSSQTLTITTPILTVTVRSPNFNRPGQLNFVFSAAVPTAETIRVKGLRKAGISSANDFIRMEEDIDFGLDVDSTKYFARILSVELLDASGDTVTATAETLTLTSVPGGFETVVKVADAILPKYTIEAEVAGVPRLIQGAQFVGGTINNEGTLNVELDVLARRVDRRRNVDSGWDEVFTTVMEENPDDFPFVSIGFFTGIGGYLVIDGDAVLFDSAPITINSNYGFDTEKGGSLFRNEAERQGRRQVTMTVSAKYEAGSSTDDIYIKWDNKFRDNAAVKVRLVQYRWDDSGQQKALIWNMGYCEITAPVRVEATAPGSVPITVALKATPDPTTTETAEIQLTIINDDMA